MACKNLLIIFSVATMLLACANGYSQKLYKWTDAQGNVHYSDTMPPEYSKRARIELDRKGNKVKNISRAKTAQEYLEEDRKRARLAAIKKAQEARRREDIRLRRLYPNEQAITHLRDAKIAAIENGISLNADALKIYKSNIASLRKTAAEYARARKRVPGKVRRKIANYRRMISDMELNVKRQRAKQQGIRVHYEKVLSRYREIK